MIHMILDITMILDVTMIPLLDIMIDDINIDDASILP